MEGIHASEHNEEGRDTRLQDLEFEPLDRSMGEQSSPYEAMSVDHVKEVLSSVDYEQLRSIFSEYRKRSGVAADDSRFLDSDKIEISSELEGAAASFAPRSGKIKFSPKYMARIVKKPENDLGRFALSVLVHEETHASGNNIEPNTLEALIKKIRVFFSEYGNEEFAQMGYSKETLSKMGLFADFVYFNEGVTDMIAGEVYDEYIKRSGDGEEIAAGSGNSAFIEGYPGSRKLLGAFITRMADATGVPPDKIWEGVKQGYFAGMDLQSSSLAQFFNDTYFPGFIYEVNDIDVTKRTGIPGQYRVPDPEVQIDRIIDRLCAKSLPEGASRYFEDFIQKLGGDRA